MSTNQPPRITAIFETVAGRIIGTTEAPVKRVEQQDDGSFTVVIDHWPEPPQPSPDVEKLAEEITELDSVQALYPDGKSRRDISAILARAFAGKDAAGARLNKEAGELASEVVQWRQHAERAEAELAEAKKSHESERLLRVRYQEHFDRAIAARDQLRAEVARLKLAAVAAIEAASKYTAAGMHEEAALVRQDFAEDDTIKEFEALREKANSAEELRAEVHGWRLIHSEPDKMVQELNQLRAEVDRLISALKENAISADIIAAEIRQAGVNRHGINRDIGFIKERCSAAIARNQS